MHSPDVVGAAAKCQGHKQQPSVETVRETDTMVLKRPESQPDKTGQKYWSGEVTSRSNALDLEEGVFTFDSPRKIAQSLKRSAEASQRRKGTPYQSAMSMLNFYINRAGKNLPDDRKQVLESAKDELRKAFGRD